MLQLPATGKRFSKAQIADITRGAKMVERRPKRDPLMAMVSHADRVLDKVLVATNAVFAAKEKLAKDDRGWPGTYIPDDLLNVRWSNGFVFTSESHIISEFRSARRCFQGQIRHYRERLRSHRPGHGMANVEAEIRDGIAAGKRKLALLDAHFEPMKAAHRREAKRLARVQREAGLLTARKAFGRAHTQLWKITKAIADQKPATAEGALALMMYVQRRMSDGCGADFAHDGNLPVLLRRAYDYLAKVA